jgi:putative endonuclease
VYFYKDENDTTQKYEYCSLCTKGPYTQDERDKKYKVVGDKHSLVYCLECAKINHIGGLDIYSAVEDTPSVVLMPVEPEIAPIAIIAPTSVVEPISVPVLAVSPPPPKPVKKKISEPVTLIAADTPKDKTDPADRQKYNAALTQELNGKKPIPTKGPYFCYIGQCSDESYVCGVTKDIRKETALINNGGAPKSGKLPIEIIYYRTEKELSGARMARDILSKYKREQKERLVGMFEKQLFERD